MSRADQSAVNFDQQTNDLVSTSHRTNYETNISSATFKKQQGLVRPELSSQDAFLLGASQIQTPEAAIDSAEENDDVSGVAGGSPGSGMGSPDSSDATDKVIPRGGKSNYTTGKNALRY
jgi:hypothetical protein